MSKQNFPLYTIKIEKKANEIPYLTVFAEKSKNNTLSGSDAQGANTLCYILNCLTMQPDVKNLKREGATHSFSSSLSLLWIAFTFFIKQP